MNRFRKIVVKIGSTLVTDVGNGQDIEMIAAWARQMAQLRKQGIDIVRVSCGSIAEDLA